MSVSTPARTMGGEVDQQLNAWNQATATAAFAATGTVVTEINNLTNAPDLAEVSAKMPATRKPTIQDKASGCQMKLVIGRPAISIDFWTRPKAVRTQVERTVAAIPA